MLCRPITPHMSTLTTIAFLSDPTHVDGHFIDIDTTIPIGGAYKTLSGCLRFDNRSCLQFETTSQGSQNASKPKVLWMIEASVRAISVFLKASSLLSTGVRLHRWVPILWVLIRILLKLMIFAVISSG